MEMNKTDASMTSGTFENPPEQQNFMDSFLINVDEQKTLIPFCAW